jgi:uncharacterized protein
MREELPLQELFTRLREAGLPLGLNDYQAVVKAMQGGYGVENRAALERLCRMLWVRSDDEQRVFEYCFAELMEGSVNPPILKDFEPGSVSPVLRARGRFGLLKNLLKTPWGKPIVICLLGLTAWSAITLISRFSEPDKKPLPPSKSEKAAIDVAPAQPVPVAPQPAPSTPPPKPQSSPPSIGVWQFFVLQLLAATVTAIGIILLLRRIQQSRSAKPKERPSRNAIQKNPSNQLLNDSNDEIQIAKAMRKSEHRNSNAGSLTDYLPVTQRQMKQSWRYLRRFVREGVPTELDVAATVRHIAQNGMLLNPVLVPPRRNQTELLLLIDQDGSMVAFHSLSVRLMETASRGGRLGDAGVYYFHNCPIDYVYHDPKHQQAEPLGNWFGQVSRSRSVVLIFSDAGAARGGANPERIAGTKKFLAELRPQVRYVAWLNPLPKARWEGTSAEAIAQLTPMFEISRQGMDGAISALRGRGRLGL